MTTEDLIQYYFQQGYTHEEIMNFLSENNGIVICIRQLQRILKKLGLKRKNVVESDIYTICAAVIEELNGSGKNVGYKTLWRRLQQFYKLAVKRSTVLDILRIADPDGIMHRSHRRLSRRKYTVPGPNFLWHIDGYDKLEPFGFAIHGCIDGFSRKILWLEVASSNNKPEVIAFYYLQTVKKLQLLPTLIRSDLGAENVIVEQLQQGLHYHHADKLSGTKSFIKGKSTSNQRIKCFWSQMRRQGANFWISLFKDMRDLSIIDDSNKLHIECLRYCFGPIIRNDLKIIRKEWNNHRIRKQKSRELVAGKPNCLFYISDKYGYRNYKKELNLNNVEICLNDYSIEPQLIDSDFEELVHILMPRVTTPSCIEDALNLYIQLLENISEYDEV